jgi:hypothetical protein
MKLVPDVSQTVSSPTLVADVTDTTAHHTYSPRLYTDCPCTDHWDNYSPLLSPWSVLAQPGAQSVCGCDTNTSTPQDGEEPVSNMLDTNSIFCWSITWEDFKAHTTAIKASNHEFTLTLFKAMALSQRQDWGTWQIIESLSTDNCSQM